MPGNTRLEIPGPSPCARLSGRFAATGSAWDNASRRNFPNCRRASMAGSHAIRRRPAGVRTGGPSGSPRAHFRPKPPRWISSDSHSCDTAFAIFLRSRFPGNSSPAPSARRREPRPCATVRHGGCTSTPRRRTRTSSSGPRTATPDSVTSPRASFSSRPILVCTSRAANGTRLTSTAACSRCPWCMRCRPRASLSCCLNLCNYFFQDVAVHRACRIPAWETPIMMIAIGYPAAEFQVAVSARLDTEAVLSWRTL